MELGKMRRLAARVDLEVVENADSLWRVIGRQFQEREHFSCELRSACSRSCADLDTLRSNL